MQQIIIKKIKASSFFKLFILTGLSWGIILGVLFFIMIGLCGIGNVQFNDITYDGLIGGIVSIVILPAIGVSMSFIFAVFSYFPFIALVKVLKKVRIYGDFEDDRLNNL